MEPKPPVNPPCRLRIGFLFSGFRVAEGTGVTGLLRPSDPV